MDAFDLSAIAKGKLSLADALKQIETVSNAFKKAERIEKKLSYHDSLLTDIKQAMENFATCAFVNSRLEELGIRFENVIKSKFEEFSTQYMFQLNEKANTSDVESLLGQRVTWTAFNNFSQQINILKARVEKHILSDFEGFKTKMKLELSHKANEKKPDEDINIDEIHQLKNRVTSLEQKYHDMFMEENLDESEDYDSQEAMDNMIEDLEKNEIKEKGSDEGINEGEQEEFQEIGKKFQIPVIPINASSEESKFQSPDTISPRSDNLETAKTEVSEESSKKNINTDSKILDDNKSTPQKGAPLYIDSQVSEKKNNEILDTSNEQGGLQPKPKSRNSIEIDNIEPSSPKHLRGKSSSRADNQTLTRKNSMASSIGGNMTGTGAGMNGGLRQLNKKVIALQKDIEGDKASLEEAKEKLLEHITEFSMVYAKIEEVRLRCEEVEVKRQSMEMSFIKALRRNGIDKKNKANQKVVGNIDAEQMIKIQEQINRKTKKIKNITTYVEKIASDT